MFLPICFSTSLASISPIRRSLAFVNEVLQSESDVVSIKYVVLNERDSMRYYGVFHVMDNERRSSPQVVVVTTDDGTVTSYRGVDEYWLLARAVAEKANILDVVYGPAQFVLDEIDAPITPEVRAYVDNWANDAGLRHLVGGLAREEPYLDSGPNWVAFLADDAYIEAQVKLGIDFTVLCIDAYLLSEIDTKPTEQDIQSWIDRQPKPRLGVLSVGSRESEEGEVEHLPLLTVDAQLDSILAEFIRDLVFSFAEAWDSKAVAVIPDRDLGGGDGDGGVYQYRPAEVTPRNAWLLMGDEASYPAPEDLLAQRERTEAGIFDYDWTAPKNGELGDLVLVYFVAPRKAACFVARLATRPHWQTHVEVNTVGAVDIHQWWAQLTALVEIEPIPYKALQEAAGGFLPLRGRSGHYLSPQTVQALSFVAKDPERQADVDQIAQVPSGNPELPESVEGIDEWKAIPAGALPLEAKVSEHIVKPLLDLLWNAPYSTAEHPLYDRTLGPILMEEHRVPSGYVDFVMCYGGPPLPALAIEVKLTVLRPASGVWIDSPDFRQLQRYMSDLDLPGLLVDAQRIMLVKRGADTPFAEIVRADATWDDIALIRDLLLEDSIAKRIPLDPRAAPTRRVARRDKSLEPSTLQQKHVESERPIEAGKFQVREDSQWVCEYDYERRIASLTLCKGQDVMGHHWSGIALSESLSDPEGRFQVFVAWRANGEARFRPDDDSQVIVKIVAALDDDGGLVAPHPNFDHGFIGSYTIWPYKDVGERLGLDHWLWWRKGWPFHGELRSWSEAAEVEVD